MKNLSAFRICCFTVFWLIVTLVGLELALRSGFPWNSQRLSPYLPRFWNDFWTYNTISIYSDGKTKNFTPLYVLGGSVCLEGFDFKVLNSALELKELKVQLVPLCSSWRSFTDDMKIVSKIGFDKNYIFVVDAPRFKDTKEKELHKKLKNGRFEVKYGSLSLPIRFGRELLELGMISLIKENILIFNASIMLGESIREQVSSYLRNGSFREYDLLQNSPGHNKTMKRKIKKIIMKNFSKKEYVESLSRLPVSLFEEILGEIRKHQGSILILNFPENPEFKDLSEKAFEGYDEKIKSIAKKFQGKFVDMKRSHNWSPSDFRDFHHMNIKGRKKSINVFKKSLKRSFSKEL